MVENAQCRNQLVAVAEGMLSPTWTTAAMAFA